MLLWDFIGEKLENLIRINFRYSGYSGYNISGIKLIPFLFISLFHETVSKRYHCRDFIRKGVKKIYIRILICAINIRQVGINGIFFLSLNLFPKNVFSKILGGLYWQKGMEKVKRKFSLF